jgi:3-methyl-2-oxobutanoate hydroxymethyltransferase
VKALRKSGTEVMGHVGLLPQTAGKYSVQGKGAKEGERILNDAVALEKAGCFAVVLECIPAALAKRITESIECPTIGIGAGPSCSGQVLVLNDLLGFNADGFKPRFVKRYADISGAVKKAVASFAAEVREGKYPDRKFSYG